MFQTTNQISKKNTKHIEPNQPWPTNHLGVILIHAPLPTALHLESKVSRRHDDPWRIQVTIFQRKSDFPGEIPELPAKIEISRKISQSNQIIYHKYISISTTYIYTLVLSLVLLLCLLFIYHDWLLLVLLLLLFLLLLLLLLLLLFLQLLLLLLQIFIYILYILTGRDLRRRLKVDQERLGILQRKFTT